MRGSYYDRRSIVVQLEVAGMDTQQAEAVANAIGSSKDPAVTRAEMRAALRWAALGPSLSTSSSRWSSSDGCSDG